VGGIARAVVGVSARRQTVAPARAGTVAVRVSGRRTGEGERGEESAGKAAGQAAERLAPREPARQLSGQRIEIELSVHHGFLPSREAAAARVSELKRAFITVDRS
jgi:hypothetical protein